MDDISRDVLDHRKYYHTSVAGDYQNIDLKHEYQSVMHPGEAYVDPCPDKPHIVKKAPEETPYILRDLTGPVLQEFFQCKHNYIQLNGKFAKDWAQVFLKQLREEIYVTKKLSVPKFSESTFVKCVFELISYAIQAGGENLEAAVSDALDVLRYVHSYKDQSLEMKSNYDPGMELLWQIEQTLQIFQRLKEEQKDPFCRLINETPLKHGSLYYVVGPADNPNMMLWGDWKTTPPVSKSGLNISISQIACANLTGKDKRMGKSDSSDPYVEFGQIKEGKYHKLQKTAVIKTNLFPKWTNLDLKFEADSTLPLIVSVYDHDLIGKDDFLGACQLDLGVLHHIKEKLSQQDIPKLKVLAKLEAAEYSSTTPNPNQSPLNRSIIELEFTDL